MHVVRICWLRSGSREAAGSPASVAGWLPKAIVAGAALALFAAPAFDQQVGDFFSDVRSGDHGIGAVCGLQKAVEHPGRGGWLEGAGTRLKELPA